MPDVIPGGSPRNPMGVAAMTLAGGEYAIHGTNMPGSIGGFVSYGCIRMLNADISDLYQRVSVGTTVVVYALIQPRSTAALRPEPGALLQLDVRALEIRGDALVLPIAIAGRLRPLRALELLGRRLGVCRGGLPARFGFGERALGRRRERFAFRRDAVGDGSSVIAGFPICRTRSLTRALRQRWYSAVVKTIGRFLHLAYSHVRVMRFCRWRSQTRDRSTSPEMFPLHASSKICPAIRSARSCGAADRGGYSRRRAAQAAHAGRTARWRRRASRTEDALRSRPRPDAAAGGDHLAPARHARPCAVAAARSRHSDRCAARAKRAVDRRRADSLDGCARSCRGRSVGAAGAVGPARREICRPGQCGAAPLRARRPAADRRGQVADAGYSADG